MARLYDHGAKSPSALPSNFPGTVKQRQYTYLTLDLENSESERLIAIEILERYGRQIYAVSRIVVWESRAWRPAEISTLLDAVESESYWLGDLAELFGEPNALILKPEADGALLEILFLMDDAALSVGELIKALQDGFRSHSSPFTLETLHT